LSGIFGPVKSPKVESRKVEDLHYCGLRLYDFRLYDLRLQKSGGDGLGEVVGDTRRVGVGVVEAQFDEEELDLREVDRQALGRPVAAAGGRVAADQAVGELVLGVGPQLALV